jgi:hypothetical protein
MIAKPNSPVHVSADALDWALKHLRRFGDTIFLPRAFEYEAIEHDWPRMRAWIQSQDMRAWSPRPYRRFLAAKTPGSFRYITQLDPVEHLGFAALMHSVGANSRPFAFPGDDDWCFLGGSHRNQMERCTTQRLDGSSSTSAAYNSRMDDMCLMLSSLTSQISSLICTFILLRGRLPVALRIGITLTAFSGFSKAGTRSFRTACRSVHHRDVFSRMLP